MSMNLQKLIRLAITAMLMKFATATTYTVGDPNGEWDFSTDLQAWASSISFEVGDSLLFQYLPGLHDVHQVSEADYSSCTASSPIQSYSSGKDTVPLSSPGKTYFICGQIGHCVQGMKIEIDTLASTRTSPSPPSSTSSPPPSSPSAPPVSTPPAATPSPPSPPVSIPSPETSPSPTPSSSASPSPSDSPSSTSPTTPTATNSTTHTASAPAPSSAYRSQSNVMLVGSMMMVLLAL